MSDETMTEAEESLYNEGFQQGLDEAEPQKTQEETLEETKNAVEESENVEPTEQETTGTEPSRSDKPSDPQEEPNPVGKNDWSDLLNEDGMPGTPTDKNPSPENADPEKKNPPAEQPPSGSPDQDDFVSSLLNNLPEDFQGVNLKEFAKDFPEEIAAAVYVAQKMMENRMKSPPEGNGLPASADAGRIERLEAYAARKAQEDYDREVFKVHPDAAKIVHEDPRFKEWMKNQGRGLREIFARSSDPKDLCMILDSYKGTKRETDPVRKSKYAGAGISTRNKAPAAKDDFLAGYELGLKE